MTYFLIQLQMNVIRYNNKYINSLNRVNNHQLNNVFMKNTKYTQQRSITISYAKKQNNHNYNDISNEKPNEISNSNKYIDKELFISITLVFSSVMVLSTCIVMILCARETSMEANTLQEKYNKLHEEIKQLEDKNIEDEMMINAIVGEIIELKSIGII